MIPIRVMADPQDQSDQELSHLKIRNSFLLWKGVMLLPQEGEINLNIPVSLMTKLYSRMLQSCGSIINIDCVDPLGHTALLMAIDNEDMEMVELLLETRYYYLFCLPNFCVCYFASIICVLFC